MLNKKIIIYSFIYFNFLELLAGSIKSIGETHKTLLLVNKIVVSYLQGRKKETKQAEQLSLEPTSEQ